MGFAPDGRVCAYAASARCVLVHSFWQLFMARTWASLFILVTRPCWVPTPMHATQSLIQVLAGLCMQSADRHVQPALEQPRRVL